MFQAWTEGQTGVPYVDANMREMAATGFMSNRGRQVCDKRLKILCSKLLSEMRKKLRTWDISKAQDVHKYSASDII